MTADAPSIGGTWTHSFEEDQGDIQIYRPAQSFAFPPSRRGRETLDFEVPGMLVSSAPGPDDRPVQSSANLSALGMNRFRIGDAQVIEVVEQGADVLKVRRV